jgi:hypothetical protein
LTPTIAAARVVAFRVVGRGFEPRDLQARIAIRTVPRRSRARPALSSLSF